MHHELAGGAFEYPLQHVSGKLALGLFGGQARFIDVRALGFVSANRSFCGHDLQKLQDAGVAEGLLLAESVVNFANCRRAACPEDAQDFEFGSGGFLRYLLHEEDHTTKVFVVSTKIFVDKRNVKVRLSFVSPTEGREFVSAIWPKV